MTGSEVTGSEPEPETGNKDRVWLALPASWGLSSLGGQESLAKVPPPHTHTRPLLLAYSEAELWGYLYPLQQIF